MRQMTGLGTVFAETKVRKNLFKGKILQIKATGKSFPINNGSVLLKENRQQECNPPRDSLVGAHSSRWGSAGAFSLALLSHATEWFSPDIGRIDLPSCLENPRCRPLPPGGQ